MKDAIYEALFTNADLDTEHLAQEQYNALIARLRELRDAPEPVPYGDILTDEEYKEWCAWIAQRDLAIELLAMLGEE